MHLGSTWRKEMPVRTERKKTRDFTKSILLLWKLKQEKFQTWGMNTIKYYVDLKIYEDEVKIIYFLMTTGDL